MGRGIPKASKQIKIVIDRLKKGPAYQSELEKLKVDNRGKTIPHSSMNRILNYYLLYWQLVEKKQEGKLEKWIWRDLPRYKTKSEYEVALKHSHNLIPGLEAIWARIPLETIESKYLDPLIRKKYMDKVEKGKRYVELALNHLATGYNDIFVALVQFQELAKLNLTTLELDREFYRLKMKELSEANIPKTKFKKLMRSAKIMLNMERKVTRKQYESYLRERKEIMDLNLHSDAMYLEEAMEKDLINWLRFLIWKIREGTPLQGHCSLCPNIRIEE